MTTAGQCVGAGVVVVRDGETLAFPMRGDDPLTGDVEGLVPGERFGIVVWIAETGREYAAAVSIEGGSEFAPNGLLVVTSLAVGNATGTETSSPPRLLPCANTPNPSIRRRLSSSHPPQCRTELTVYDVGGRKRQRLPTVSIPLVSTASSGKRCGTAERGVFLPITAGEHTDTKKMLLLK
jgi:hypothetical protein